MIYVVGDIHGNVKAWDNIKKEINFSPEDIMIVIGDVIDRNYGGISIIEEIMNSDNIQMILGNHEDMMYRYLKTKDERCKHHWLQNGGVVTLDEFNKLSEDRQREIIKFIDNLHTVINITTNGKTFEICHAAPPETYIPENSRLDQFTHILWDRTSFREPADLGHPVILGHTPTCNISGFGNDSFEIVRLEHDWYMIDCGAAYIGRGRLGCLRLDDMKSFYSN